MREMRALSAPLQLAIKDLEAEELETRKFYSEVERRINLQEVRVWSRVWSVPGTPFGRSVPGTPFGRMQRHLTPCPPLPCLASTIAQNK
jgi:hypothetical protein